MRGTLRVPDLSWNLQATENVSQTIGRITQALAGLDSSDTKTFGQMVRNLSNAETATIRTATALQRLETVQAQTDAAQSRAASAALRLSQAQEQAARGYRDVGQAATQHAPAAASFFSNALSAATGFLAANVFSRITGQIGDLVSGTVHAASSMESTRKGFETILQSANAADQLIRQLQTEANKSPFELENFRQGAQLLLGMGTAAQDIVPRLHEVSNVVAAVGGGTEQFNRVNLALSQIQAKGKVQAQEINQLAENGVAGWDILAKAMNKTQAQVIDLASQGKISAQEFFQAFAQFANSDQISKAAEAQSHTFQGLLSTISDIGQALETAFGTPVIAAVEPVLEQIVTSLNDPNVITTLGQWGAAAGQFAVGLIQAGQTAFTVAQQIIQALQPVTDFLGGLLGIQGGPTIKPPDLTGPSLSAAQYSSNIAAAGPAAKSAKDQVADLERQTRELSRATAEANVGYDHRKQSLQDQLTLLDRQYQAENKAADISSLQEKIAKDRALAVDQYSSQGQAAASRLVDEEARLKALQREQGHDAAKNAIEDRIKAVDREKQATDEASAARTRALQEQMDALRANAAATTALTNAIKPPPSAGPDKSRNRNVNDAFGDDQTRPKATGLIDLLNQVRDALTGDQGLMAAIGATGTAWGQLTDTFGAAGPGLTQLKENIGAIAHALGLDAGFAAESVIAQVAFKQFAESSAAVVPQNLAVVGSALRELNDQFNVTAKGLTLITDKLKGADQGTIDQDLAALGLALRQQDTDRQRGVAGYFQQVAQGQQRTGAAAQQNVQDLIKGLQSANGQGLVDRPATTTGTDFGPGVTTTTASRNAPPRAEVVLTFDENGVAHAIQKHTSADRLLRVMGDAVR
jgi:tape measure domain-containing protein